MESEILSKSPLSFNFNKKCDESNWLYHYTSCNTAIQHIMCENGTLQLNVFEDVNDPREGKFMGSTGSVKTITDDEAIRCSKLAAEFFRKRLKVLCFSMTDTRTFIPDTYVPNYIRGHLKPRMWATYGQRHKGACLVFDKERLIKSISKTWLKNTNLFYGSVRYERAIDTPAGLGWESYPDRSSAYAYDLDDIHKRGEQALHKHVILNQQNILFHKDQDWEGENEYRFAIIGDSINPEYLTFGDALHGVVLGAECADDDVKLIRELAIKLEIPAIRLGYSTYSHAQQALNEYAKQIPIS